MVRSHVTALMLASALVVGGAGVAGAQLANEALRCAPEEPEMSPHRYLRSVSLDLRGVVADKADHEALDEVIAAGADVDAWLSEQIDAWMSTDAFAERVVRRHQALLWNSLSNVRLFNNNANLNRSGELYYRANLGQRLYRGARVPCLDEPARFGPNGEVLYETDESGVRREGWVWVEPYWSPGSPIKVCAFDAQDISTSASGTDCSTTRAYRDMSCGCGPEMRWCQYRNEANAAIVQSMAEAMDMRIATVVEEGRNYLELFQGRRAWVNGPLAHFYRHQREITGGLAFEPGPMPAYLIPDLAFTDRDTWVEVRLPASHAGVLTDPAFLLRFQTNRARANRFFDAFLCQPFSPPDAPLPVVAEGAALEPDLQKRAGCKYCHALLEPSAAHWGRWNEQGAGFLDPEGYPELREDCFACATGASGCSADCRRYYVTQAFSVEEEPYLGTLKAYLFRRDDHMHNVEEGPAFLAMTGVADGRLPECTANRTAEWLLGRPVAEKEQPWIAELTRTFVFEGYDYRQLIKHVLTSPVYRRVR